MLRTVSSGNGLRVTGYVKDIFLCIVSGLLLALPFTCGTLWFCAWIGFLPVFFSLNNKSLPEAALLFFITGIVFWSATIYWLVHVTLAGTIVLIIYLAVYFAAFGLIIRPATRQSRPCALLFIPSVWVLLEYVRGHCLTGFPWALLGYSQYLNLPVIQIADITGAYGVSFLVVLVNAALVEMLWSARTRQAARFATTVIVVSLILIPALYYGYRSISFRHALPEDRQAIRVSVIQGNVPQEMKWDRHSQDFIIDKYITITKEAAKDKPDLIVWPEAALPVVAEEEPVYYDYVKSCAQELRIPLAIGAVTMRDRHYYNSCLLISRDGVLSGRYDKMHLVPFGEYIPLRKVFTFLETIVPIGEVSRGREYTVLSLPAGDASSPARFSVLICFEDLFPELSRGFVRQGARFLVNITNDAWYKKTSSAYQHFQASVFRAVENRVCLVRAANTGVSGFIAPSGKIISLVRDRKGETLFVDGYATCPVPSDAHGLTFYTRRGDVFILALGFGLACGIAWKSRRKLLKRSA